jgi:alkylresorcinol/alkylpyrone synthase
MDSAPGLIVSNCIFGDGAAAAVLTKATGDGLARVLDFESELATRHREDLCYRTMPDGRLQNVLSRRVPVLGARVGSRAAERLLARHASGVKDVAHWAVHAGGTAVLKELAKKLNLQPDALQASDHVFRNFGNMSSPTVLFALRRVLDVEQPGPGASGLLLAFGAGFTGHAALLEFL